MSREDYQDLRELTKQLHAERVAKTPARISFAIYQFHSYGIPYKLKNPTTGHFHVWDKDGNLYQFWAGTGRIYERDDKRGIKALLTLVRGQETKCVPMTQQQK